MIDAPDRKEPRFPAYKEEAAKQEIHKQLLLQKEKAAHPLHGIASAACGGDILFHESCMELGIPSEIYLAALPEKFKEGSVSFAGKNWEERFNHLLQQLPVHVLPDDKGDADNMNIYERTNEWMLEKALSAGGKNLTLVALWDGGGGDGKGGTAHMVNITKEQRGEVEVIDTKTL